jgi:aminoglycoside-2''-adenylyltransferase
VEAESPNRKRHPELIPAQVCRALNKADAKYLVIGGIACILHGYVRATTDLDILIERSPGNAERILRGLAKLGYGFAGELTANELVARPITVIGDDPAVDIFTVAWTVKYEQAVARGVSAEVEGVHIPYISLEDLIATKRTGRLQDAADIEVLEEIKRVRQALQG